MKLQLTNKRAVTACLSFMIIGFLAGFLMAYSVYGTMNLDVGMSTLQLSLISALQIGVIYGFCLGTAGYLQAKRTGLNKGIFFEKAALNKKGVLASVGLAFSVVAIMMIFEKLIFIPAIPLLSASYSAAVTPLSIASAVLYGGLLEEIMLRLFFMTMICSILSRFKKEYGQLSTWIYYTAIILSSLVFAAGHLPATNATFGLSGIIVFRCMLLNSIAGLACGYLYYKYALEYAMLCHISFHLILNLIFIPIMF